MNTISSIYKVCSKISKKNGSLYRLCESIRVLYHSRIEPQLSVMKSQIKPGSIIYDIGAYHGLYSITIAKTIKNSIVYAFEPNPNTYNELCENIKRMKLSDRIIPKNLALSDDNVRKTLYITSNDKRSSLKKDFAIKDDVIIYDTEIDTASIDYLVENGICKSPDILKIDVQGYEIEVLTGAKETLVSKHPHIFIEPHKNQNRVSTKNRIVELLSQLKYDHESLGNAIWFYKR